MVTLCPTTSTLFTPLLIWVEIVARQRPTAANMAIKFVWPVYASYDIFMADLNGNIVEQLTNTPGYDAEATLSPDGKKMLFTSIRNGDLDLYIMDLKTKKVKQVTNELGYDGGAWFSPDGKRSYGVRAGRKVILLLPNTSNCLLMVWCPNANGSIYCRYRWQQC